MIDQERLRNLAAVLRRRTVVITIGAVVVALVAGTLARSAGRDGSTGTAGASRPPTSAGPGVATVPGADPSADPDPAFRPIAGTSPGPVAVLTAHGATGPVVPLDVGFRLESVDATPASALAARLTVEPAFAFTVTPEAGDRAAVLKPVATLVAGTVYRFALSGTTGGLLDSWAFQARQPLRIVGTLPSDQTVDVPLDSGIEITFDQDGATDTESHLTVTPATPGRFERHGRVVAFIPAKPLTARTLYAVTVSQGVKLAGTAETTIVDTTFRFETAGAVDPGEVATLSFEDDLVESPTAERPIVGVWLFGNSETPAPKALPIEVFRLADLDAGIAAFRSLRTRPDWTRWSTEGLVDTSVLRRIVAADLPLQAQQDAYWFRLPAVLNAGWYLVQQTAGSRPVQAVLQVTDVSGYLAVSDTQTLVWANDVASGDPIRGATVAAPGTSGASGAAIGRTDARGLAIGPTPAGLLPRIGDTCDRPCDPVVTIRMSDGRAIFLPAAAGQDKIEGFGDSYWWADADPAYWSLLHTDRNLYRRSDTVHLWGVTRDRDNGDVPAKITVRILSEIDDASALSQPSLASLSLVPGATGAFTGSLSLDAVPEGNYTVALLVGEDVIRTTRFSVGPIVKPAYRLEVETGRRVYVVGDQIKITARARFFEGTPVPGVPLRIDGYIEQEVATDADGVMIHRTTATVEPEQEGPSVTTIDVSPARAEEAEIAAASREIVVFPSSRTVDATTTIADGRVRVSGGVHDVAIDRLESEIAAGRSLGDLDPRGAAVAGATVTVAFIELIPVRRERGTEYDFIEKKVVQVYDVDIVERAAGTIRVRTAADGSWSASIPADDQDHDYQITVAVADPDGHTARASSFATRGVASVYDQGRASLSLTDPNADREPTFAVGDRIDLTLTDAELVQGAGDGSTYLFFQAQRGIRSATVQDSPRFVTTLPSWGIPDMDVGAVRFTGHGYVGTVRFNATFRVADRSLEVDLSVAAPRYAPGDQATVRVRTLDATGRPVAATVVLRAVDEKLFSIGAATAEDPLSELYSPLQAGVRGTYDSHRTPRSQPEGGDTTGGGGDREHFRDSLLFEAITTGPDGRGTASFRVSDDLTSWRVTGAAITSRLQAGVGSVLVPVGLPFFVDAAIAPEYLVADQPSIAIRSYGSALPSGAAVTVEVTSKTLGFNSGPLRTTAFATLDVALPRLVSGRHTITIEATSGSGATARTDRLVRTFDVVATRLTRVRTAYLELTGSTAPRGGDDVTTLVVSDASGGRHLALLQGLADGGGARLDRALGAELAAGLLADRFHLERPSATSPFVIGRYQGRDGGLALLPYASSDLELSALVAIVAPERIAGTALPTWFRAILGDSSETRERRMYAMAGLAGLGDGVLAALQAAAGDPELTIRERLVVGLASAALGDTATARAIYNDLLGTHGEQSGSLARLRVGASAADITAGTSLMAMLGASIGDPRAPALWAYVEANPDHDTLQVLPAIGYVTALLDRLPFQAAQFAYTIDGTRRVVALAAGESFEIRLGAKQLASLTVERLAGTVGVTTSWREAVRPSDLAADPDVTMTRSVQPAGTIDAADLERIDLVMTFGPQAAAGCHDVTELVPSGLAPVSSLAAWLDPDAEPVATSGVVQAYDQSGSRMSFCAGPSTSSRTATLRYYARVVTAGTYAWEPAIAESRSQDGRAALTPTTTIEIR